MIPRHSGSSTGSSASSQEANWALCPLSAGRKCCQSGKEAADCRLQAGYSLSKNIAAGRKSSADWEPLGKWDGATPDEGQHRLSLHKSKNQRTLSPQTENSPTLLKTAKKTKNKKPNEALAIVSKYHKQSTI